MDAGLIRHIPTQRAEVPVRKPALGTHGAPRASAGAFGMAVGRVDVHSRSVCQQLSATMSLIRHVIEYWCASSGIANRRLPEQIRKKEHALHGRLARISKNVGPCPYTRDMPFGPYTQSGIRSTHTCLTSVADGPGTKCGRSTHLCH